MIKSKLGVVVTCEIEMSASKADNEPKFDQRYDSFSSFSSVSTHIKVKPTVWESLPVLASKAVLKGV